MLIRKLILMIACSFFMMSYCKAEQALFYDTQGHTVSLSKLKGKWVVLNYWADWCNVCVQEIPELNRFYEDIKDKNIVFYGIDYDELTLNNLKSSIASVSIKYPVLTSDPGYTWNLDNVDVVPTTFILDPEGHVVKVMTGPNTERSLFDVINSLQSTAIPAKPASLDAARL
jgi:peroxiredoxin